MAKAYEESLRMKEKFGDKDVTHARWKGAGMGDYECTNCWEITSGGDELDTCPHCGAYMSTKN